MPQLANTSGVGFTPELRQIPGTKLTWTTLRDWLALVHAVCGPIRCRTSEHQRRAKLCRSLTLDDIRACTDVDALDAAADLFDRSRRDDAGLHHGPFRSLTRAEIAARLVECRNQADRLRSGAAFRARTPGPRFDPARLPANALDRLIQTHPDLATVDQLRVERRRRQEAATALAPLPAPLAA